LIKPDQVARALDILALLAVDDTAAKTGFASRNAKGECPYCGGDQWEWIDGKWLVGHDVNCPIIKARDLMTEIINDL